MKIARLFTRSLPGPYADQKYETRRCQIREADGRTVFTQDDVVVPADWSQTACDILAQKYFRHAGSGFAGETDARQVFHRLAGCWTDWGKRYGYFDGEDDAKAFYDEIAYMLAHQMAAPNSPQWFNTGLAFAYGISGDPQGHWYVEPSTGEITASTSAYQRPQAHACFIQSISDDLVNPRGIFDLWVREARLFKFGSGTGTNFSRLRAAGETVKGGGVSSGLMSFLRVGDAAAAAIQSGGTTRRAAKMVCIDADHPEIEAFVDWKVNEERKVAALVMGMRARQRLLEAIIQAIRTASQTAPNGEAAVTAAVNAARDAGLPESHLRQALWRARAGLPPVPEPLFDFDWQGEAYRTVSGQNSNNSIRLTGKFFEALEREGVWELRWRTSGEVARAVPARALWDRIAAAAWSCADPGLHFATTINEWHTCPAGGPIQASNPCSEYLFLDDTGCNLASLNLLRFYEEAKGELRLEALSHACRLWTVVLEISVLMAQFPSPEIAQRSFEYRTLGLGYANLGALLMSMGIPYGDVRGRALAGGLTALLTGESYACSAEMAREKGPFARFAENREAMLRVIRNHRRALVGGEDFEGLTQPPQPLDRALCPPALFRAAQVAWDRALAAGQAHGFRNAQVTAIAPTGTIGLLMDCDTMGIEPEFALVKGKQLAGGGYLRMLNRSLPRALKALGYDAAGIEAIRTYCLGTASLRTAPVLSWSALLAKGIPESWLQELESAIPRAWNLETLFSPAFIDEKLARALGVDLARWRTVEFSLLRHLGFSAEQVQAADRHIFGERGIEGAPGLRPADYAVFDCAQPCGRNGKRSLDFPAHLGIMAAAQPFLSGGISKTINLPKDASPQTVQQAFLTAWKLGIKAVCVYRDGSKLSQPLTGETSPQPPAEAPLCIECG